MAPPTSLIEWKEARWLIRGAITSASILCSRPPLRNMTGSIASSRLASVIGKPTVRFTASSKCYDQLVITRQDPRYPASHLQNAIHAILEAEFSANAEKAARCQTENTSNSSE